MRVEGLALAKERQISRNHSMGCAHEWQQFTVAVNWGPGAWGLDWDDQVEREKCKKQLGTSCCLTVAGSHNCLGVPKSS